MSKTVRAIPEGYHSITPGMSVRGAVQAIEFYKRAFGAEERMRLAGPDGAVMHCEVQISDSIFMFGDAVNQPVFPMRVMLYVSDCDAVFKRAVEAGAVATQPLADQFYGDRSGHVTDPFGNEWLIATHVEDVSPEEMDRRMRAMTNGDTPA